MSGSGASADTSRPRIVTREELYEEIWRRPVRTVAAEWGVSNVALAKICKKLDVPRPRVGHWTRLLHGHRLPRTELPSRRRAVPAQAEIHGVVGAAPRPPSPKPVFPIIGISEMLSRPHATVRRIRTALDAQELHHGALALPAERETVVRVTPACRRRALVFLDGLAKGLATRGHELVFGVKHEPRWTTYSLAAYVGDQPVDVALYEPTRQIAHVRTKREGVAEARGRNVFIPEYDFSSTGIFKLTIGGRFGAARRTWSDGKRRRLEALLGEIVVGLERAAEILIEEERRYEERRRSALEQDRRRAIAERQAAQVRVLDADLFQMVRLWRDAEDVRAFLCAVEERTAPELRTEIFTA